MRAWVVGATAIGALLVGAGCSCGADTASGADVDAEAGWPDAAGDVTEDGSGDAVLADAAADGESPDVGPDGGDAPEDTIDETNETTGGDGGVDAAAAFDYPCEPGTERACVTSCESAGQQLCLKDWGPCVPPGEWCGNCEDDDCDGLANEDCAPNPECQPGPDPECPVAVITLEEALPVFAPTTLHLSAASSWGPDGAITAWAWELEAPDGADEVMSPSAAVETPTYVAALPGTYLFTLRVWDAQGTQSCLDAQLSVEVLVYPSVDPEVGCADGEREGFLDLDTWSHIAGCAGAWDQPGITPASVTSTCGLAGGDDGGNPEGTGCSAPDLCAAGWHICDGWQEVAAKSPTGCAGAAPPDAKPKSLFFAIRQPSENYIECGEPGDGINDVFGCGNLGVGIGADKGCGPLDRALASTQPNTCGYNEAQPPHGPWECPGGPGSDLEEGGSVIKHGCPDTSCSYDGYPVGSSDKGGVVCCRD